MTEQALNDNDSGDRASILRKRLLKKKLARLPQVEGKENRGSIVGDIKLQNGISQLVNKGNIPEQVALDKNVHESGGDNVRRLKEIRALIIENNRRTAELKKQLTQAESSQKAAQRVQYERERNDKSVISAIRLKAVRNRRENEDCDRIDLKGIKYAIMTNRGNKLVPLTVWDPKDTQDIPWNGYVYKRNRDGTLYTKRSNGKEYCKFFSRKGVCDKGADCRFVHAATHIKACPKILRGSECLDTRCILNHDITEFNAPLCKYFAKKQCNNESCKFIHRKFEGYEDNTIEYWTCRPFAMNGYCERGSYCPFLHFFECPDYEEEGKCPRGRNCGLPHTLTREVQLRMINTEGSYTRRHIESPHKKLINSYTINPKYLNVDGQAGGTQFIIDTHGNSRNHFIPDHEFLIGSDSDSDSESETETETDFIEI